MAINSGKQLSRPDNRKPVVITSVSIRGGVNPSAILASLKTADKLSTKDDQAIARADVSYKERGKNYSPVSLSSSPKSPSHASKTSLMSSSSSFQPKQNQAPVILAQAPGTPRSTHSVSAGYGSMPLQSNFPPSSRRCCC